MTPGIAKRRGGRIPSPSELFTVRVRSFDREYVCLVCGRTYMSRSGARQHVKRKHLQTNCNKKTKDL